MKKQRFEDVEENNHKEIEKMQLGYQLCCLVYEIVQDIPSPNLDLNTTTDNSFENLINTPSLTTIQKELDPLFSTIKWTKPYPREDYKIYITKEKGSIGVYIFTTTVEQPKKGRNPICRGCNIAIEKTEPRIIHSYIEN